MAPLPRVRVHLFQVLGNQSGCKGEKENSHLVLEDGGTLLKVGQPQARTFSHESLQENEDCRDIYFPLVL